jgi:hypothetical protein
MFLLCLDDAGSVGSKTDRHYVLSGICVFERQVHFLANAMDAPASRIHPSDPDALEFHGSHMLPGKGFWRTIRDRSVRRQHITDALGSATGLMGHWAVFGAVIEKAAVAGEDPIEYAFEELLARFDNFLKREHNRRGNTHRGLVILDRSTRETRLQGLARDLRKKGHRWGTLANLADVPMFVDSSATRAVQYADLVSYALWQKFEHGDSAFFDVIEPHFDREGAVVHGLLHRPVLRETCDCACCQMLKKSEPRKAP